MPLFSTKDGSVGMGKQPVLVLPDENFRAANHDGGGVAELLCGMVGRIGHIPLDHDLEVQGRTDLYLE